MTKISLTDTQLVILSAAAQRDDLRIEFPERLRGGAAKAVVATLLNKALIQVVEPRAAGAGDFLEDEAELARYRISRVGLAALGIESEDDEGTPLLAADLPDGDALARSVKTDQALAASAPSAAPRMGTKLASVIALLEREEGASIDELTGATGWMAHTTRAALTGLRKRGIAVERAKRDDGTTVYRVPATPAETIVEVA